jgi:hypothetical protein
MALGEERMSDEMSGGCACGRVRFTARIDDDDAYLCHCRMCQRSTGSVSIAFKNLAKAAVEWGSEPDWYESSPIARRPFCRECGTSLGFEYPDHDKMDVTVAAFDDPSRFRPTAHFGAESMHRAWLDTEGLPEQRSDDYAPLVERWRNAIGNGAG